MNVPLVEQRPDDVPVIVLAVVSAALVAHTPMASANSPVPAVSAAAVEQKPEQAAAIVIKVVQAVEVEQIPAQVAAIVIEVVSVGRFVAQTPVAAVASGIAVVSDGLVVQSPDDEDSRWIAVERLALLAHTPEADA